MVLPPKMLLWLILAVVIVSLAGCSSGQPSDPAAGAVDSYLSALVQKEENQMINLACADWESQATLEFNSFAAVKVKLEGPGCLTSGQDGTITLVTCTGKIIASYGAEDLVLELEDRTYQVIEEGGEWRMCGYR